MPAVFDLLRITDRAQADQIVETVLRGAQKARSNLLEAGYSAEGLARTTPLLFAERSVIDLCIDAVMRADEPDAERCLLAQNLIIVARELCPVIGTACDMSEVGGELPTPSWL